MHYCMTIQHYHLYNNLKTNTMKKRLFTVLLFASLASYAQQYTLIPDVNFEKALISLTLDSDAPDGKVLTAKINTLTYLNVSSKNIVDLTGIQDFVALKKLHCYSNQITSIDLSNNIALTNLICSNNPLTSLDVSNNIALVLLYCNSNQLTSLDFSKNMALKTLECNHNRLTGLDLKNNTALKYLNCFSNQLTSLDISKNTKLVNLHCNSNQLTSLDVSNNIDLFDLYCYSNQLTSLDISKNIHLLTLNCADNQLTYLNIKNGKNAYFATEVVFGPSPSNFKSNPNLTCIQVDDANYSNNKWAAIKDATATYSTNCPTLGVEEATFATIALYPVPTQGVLHIDNIVLEKATLYDALGRKVTATLTAAGNNNTIDMASLPIGIYYVYIQAAGATAVRKIVLE
jgi:Secretion system C-terminal sorting domain